MRFLPALALARVFQLPDQRPIVEATMLGDRRGDGVRPGSQATYLDEPHGSAADFALRRVHDETLALQHTKTAVEEIHPYRSANPGIENRVEAARSEHRELERGTVNVVGAGEDCDWGRVGGNWVAVSIDADCPETEILERHISEFHPPPQLLQFRLAERAARQVGRQHVNDKRVDRRLYRLRRQPNPGERYLHLRRR